MGIDPRGAPDLSHHDYAAESVRMYEQGKREGVEDKARGKKPNHYLYARASPDYSQAKGYREGYGELEPLQRVHDKRGIPIERGDIVKVFHFIGPRRKRHYMYKQCLGPQFLHPSHDQPYMMFSHLNFVEDRSATDGPYHERLGQKLGDYEIVQSIKCDHEARPRFRPTAAPAQ